MNSFSRLVRNLGMLFAQVAPIQRDVIVFENIFGKGFGENPKYIAEEIKRRGLKTRMYWLLKDSSCELPPYIQKLEYDTQKTEYVLQTAGFIVSNVRRKWRHPKRKKQVYLQTWHGGYAMKRIEKDAEMQLSASYLSQAREDGKYCDAITADCLPIETIFRTSFWLNENCEILRTGTPRCDLLIKGRGNPSIRKKVCDDLTVSEDAYLVLYAPTFRNDHSIEGYIQDFSKIQDAFTRNFGKTTILVRLHPNVVQLASSLYQYDPEKLVDATNYPDPQELVLAADCLITDYSSIAFDFSLIEKPVFMIWKDLAAYRAERGLYPIFDELPFQSGETELELASRILSFRQDEYNRALNSFYEKYPSYNVGNAAEQIVDWLIRKGLR